MPRPKGSKNKPKDIQPAAPTISIEEYDAKIKQTEAEINDLTEQLKAKKAELKKLTKGREAAEAAAEAAKAEEDKNKILEAVAASGKSVDEILEMLK